MGGVLKQEIKRIRNLLYNKIYINPKLKDEIVNKFQKLYYDSHMFGGTWSNTFWMGIPLSKCPMDLWIYQEIIFKLKPDVIIECGTAEGGSALYLASLCDLVNHGRVISIDIKTVENKPTHKRIKYLLGSSTSQETEEKIKDLIKTDEKIMVILDSDHTKQHVLNELNIYSKIVTKGSYLIVEDTNINNPVKIKDFDSGPMEAVEEFLKENKDYVIDKEKEKFYMTFNPNGYLKKIR